jgi:hypothetical protein
VQLVDEGDDLAVRVGDLLQDRLQSFLELAPVLGPGHHRPEIERHHPLVLQALGDVALDDPVGQPLDDRGLAHPGLPDQHRVVLGPTGQHLDDTTDLLVTADHRVEPAPPGRLGEVAAVAFEGLEGVLRRRRGHPVAPPHVAQGAQQLVPVRPQLVGEGQQHVLDREIVVAEVAPETVGRLEPLAGGPTEGRFPAADRVGETPRLSARRAATSSGEAPTLDSTGRAMVSGSARIAASRWAGVTSGLFASAAWRVAVEKASLVFSVHRWGSSGTAVILSGSVCGHPRARGWVLR